MKRVFFILLFIPQLIFAQAGETKIGLSIGIADPLSDFGEQTISSGLAENGINFEGNYAIGISAKSDWVFALRLTSNSVNETPFNNDLSEQLPVGATFNTSIGKWATTSFLTGLQTRIPIKEGLLDFEMKFLLGYTIASSPSISATTEYNNETITTNQSRTNSKSLGLFSGGALRIKAGEKTFFTVGANYFRTDASFAFEVRQSSSQGWNRLQTASESQTIEILGLDLGIVFKI